MTMALSLLPALGCVALMFGGGLLVRLVSRTPVARMPRLARRRSAPTGGPLPAARGSSDTLDR